MSTTTTLARNKTRSRTPHSRTPSIPLDITRSSRQSIRWFKKQSIIVSRRSKSSNSSQLCPTIWTFIERRFRPAHLPTSRLLRLTLLPMPLPVASVSATTLRSSANFCHKLCQNPSSVEWHIPARRRPGRLHLSSLQNKRRKNFALQSISVQSTGLL